MSSTNRWIRIREICLEESFVCKINFLFNKNKNRCLYKQLKLNEIVQEQDKVPKQNRAFWRGKYASARSYVDIFFRASICITIRHRTQSNFLNFSSEQTWPSGLTFLSDLTVLFTLPKYFLWIYNHQFAQWPCSTWHTLDGITVLLCSFCLVLVTWKLNWISASFVIYILYINKML